MIKTLAGLGWTQQKIAETMFLTQAAVSTYLKRENTANAADNLIQDLVARSVSIMEKDPRDTMTVMDIVCQACKVARSPGAGLCVEHVSEVPVLGVRGCTICTKYLDKAVLSMESDRRAIVQELLDSFHRMQYNKRYVSIIPEVQSNIVLGFVNPDRNDINDYAGFPGRIIKHEGEARITGAPTFGGSKHIARLVSIIRKHVPTIRSATCVIFNKKIAEILNQLGWSIIWLENENDEPAINAALRSWTGNDLDAIVFKGIVGMEPLTFILGKNATNVMDKAEKVASLL
ncbi:MAG: hypothetical protein GYA24_12405 [Candidatus Lokiarchaeota archaeon]|nr:hypothetical protein [Candidatus Lokiarchaeota archaeon]